MPVAAAIPAWAIWTAIGASTLGGVLTGASNAKQRDAELKQRNKEHLANINIQNKQLKQQSDQFSQTMALNEKQDVESGPSKLMNTLSMVQSLGTDSPSTVDNLKYFLS